MLQHVGHSQIVHRRDDPWISLPRIRVDAQATAKLECGIGVNDLEIEIELPLHFVLPLPLEHGRADDEDATDSSPQKKFFGNQPALDRLAQAHAIGQQQADARHLQGPEDRLQLVGVNLDGRVPDAEQRLVLDAIALSQPVQPSPAMSIDEGQEHIGAVGPVLVHARQRGLAQHEGRGLDFPE